MRDVHKTTVDIPMPLYKKAKEYSIPLIDAMIRGLEAEVEDRKLLTEIREGKIKVTSN